MCFNTNHLSYADTIAKCEIIVSLLDFVFIIISICIKCIVFEEVLCLKLN